MAPEAPAASRSRPVAWRPFWRRDSTSDSPIRPSSGEGDRLYYVDAIRTVAIALVLLAHVAEVFNPWDEWHITNAERSRVAGEIAVFVAPWVMPMVMLLAGVSAWYSLRRRNNTTD